MPALLREGSSVLAVSIVIGALTFGGGLGLVGDETAPPPSTVPNSPGSPIPEPPDPPQGVLVGLGILTAALLASRGPGAALGLRPPDDALVVFVPGHGQGEAVDVFASLINTMGLADDAVRGFDYRWVTGEPDAVRASQTAPVGPTAGSLNAYLAGVAGRRPVWLVGFSKGGATVAELIASWDGGAFQPPADVRGAFLLDPPIAAGWLGNLQSSGRLVGWIPDDGGYDPVDCAFLNVLCKDTRAHLGEASGVDVTVFRNPRAGITSFSDRPDGLRVIVVPDDGPGPLGQLLRNPLGLPGRIADAHEAVLFNPEVARCMVAEMAKPGSCTLGRSSPLPSLRSIARLLPSARIT